MYGFPRKGKRYRIYSLATFSRPNRSMIAMLLGILLPLLMTRGGCGESNIFENERPIDKVTVQGNLSLPSDTTVAAEVVQEKFRTSGYSTLAGGTAASPEYNISGSESAWVSDPLADPVAPIVVVRHGVSDFATESDVTEHTNEVLNASGNPDSPPPFLKDERRGDFQGSQGDGTEEPTTTDGDVDSALQPPPPQVNTYEEPGHDIPATALPARVAPEPREKCAREIRRRNKGRLSGLGIQVFEHQRPASRKSMMLSYKTSGSTLRKVKVVLSRANRNRTTTMPPESLPLLPLPPLADREDLDKLPLRERGCLPLETSPAVQDRSTCPFRFLTSFDRRRLPRLVTTVRCMCPGSTCSSRRGYRCLEISRPVTTMRRVGRVYVDTVEEMPVACVCAYVGRKSRGRSP